MIAAFKGAAKIVRRPDASLPFSIEGQSREAPEQTLLLAFTRAPADVRTEVLTDLVIETEAGGRYTLRSLEGVFGIDGARHFLHRDVGRAFYGVLPPFHVPWAKRTLWRALLLAARFRLIR